MALRHHQWRYFNFLATIRNDLVLGGREVGFMKLGFGISCYVRVLLSWFQGFGFWLGGDVRFCSAGVGNFLGLWYGMWESWTCWKTRERMVHCSCGCDNVVNALFDWLICSVPFVTLIRIDHIRYCMNVIFLCFFFSFFFVYAYFRKYQEMLIN